MLSGKFFKLMLQLLPLVHGLGFLGHCLVFLMSENSDSFHRLQSSFAWESFGLKLLHCT